MEVALLSVGDELLAGDTVNTNATWLADQLAQRGVSVGRILVVPDDHGAITDAVQRYSERYDAVVVTGGLGGTPDDITITAVADAFDRELAVDELALADVEETLAALTERRPDISVDATAEATIPAGSRPLRNREGLSPGCVVENVYVLPGIPGEMKAMFRDIADEFAGDARSAFLYTDEAEANMVDSLTAAGEQFDVAVGCYPDRSAGHNRLKVTGTDPDEVAAAIDWLQERIDARTEP